MVLTTSTLFLIAALIFSSGYYSAPIFFYNSKNLNCIGALSFFNLFTHFRDFWSQIGVVILVTSKQEME